MTDDGHARLEVLKPRSLGDTVGTYEGPVEETDVGELTAAGRRLSSMMRFRTRDWRW